MIFICLIKTFDYNVMTYSLKYVHPYSNITVILEREKDQFNIKQFWTTFAKFGQPCVELYAWQQSHFWQILTITLPGPHYMY